MDALLSAQVDSYPRTDCSLSPAKQEQRDMITRSEPIPCHSRVPHTRHSKLESATGGNAGPNACYSVLRWRGDDARTMVSGLCGGGGRLSRRFEEATLTACWKTLALRPIAALALVVGSGGLIPPLTTSSPATPRARSEVWVLLVETEQEHLLRTNLSLGRTMTLEVSALLTFMAPACVFRRGPQSIAENAG
jgi:hypothetical protein